MRKHLEINTTDVAYNEIRDMIINGIIPAGEKIKKRLIAETLGISITPVTEALKKLVGENFIEYKNRLGYFVKVYTKRQLVEFFQLRAALESIAIRLVIVAHRSGTDISSIITFWDDYQFVNMDEYVLQDNEFHKQIVTLSDNTLLIDMWIQSGYTIKSNQQGLQNSIEQSRQDHANIIEAVKKHDEEKAQLLMSEHFMRAAEHVKQQEESL